MKIKLPFILMFISCLGCSLGNEVTMPFKNYMSYGQDLSPLKSSDAQKAVRIWVSSSTSLERVITIIKDSTIGQSVRLATYGHLFKGKRHQSVYNEKIIVPQRSMDKLWLFLEKLKEDQYQNHELTEIVLHQPISRYVVEFKDGQFYKQFQFRTSGYNPDAMVTDQFQAFEQFVFREFLVQN